ncbi:MAG: flagellar biosynthetic protein FliO [Bacteroidetes bacterium]|nr:flagellar biosynthetic protein FliO [Bacteroidota bacterium]
MGPLIGQMLISLSIVLAIMVGLAYFVKRYMGFQSPAKRTLVKIEVLAHQPLQPKRSVYVVRIASSVLVLGSSEQGLQLFTELHDEQLMELLEQEPQQPGDSGRIVLNAQNLISRLTGSGSIFTQSGSRQNK